MSKKQGGIFTPTPSDPFGVIPDIHPKKEKELEVINKTQQVEFASGMVRDTAGHKVNYSLVFSGPMFERWAQRLTEGGRYYGNNNWLKAAGMEERDRFKESAIRHFVQWLYGHTDEDHAAAIFFNVNGYEYVKERLGNEDLSTGVTG
jgi:hypothetical protein